MNHNYKGQKIRFYILRSKTYPTKDKRSNFTTTPTLSFIEEIEPVHDNEEVELSQTSGSESE